jgi:hypothetical protein
MILCLRLEIHNTSALETRGPLQHYPAYKHLSHSKFLNEYMLSSISQTGWMQVTDLVGVYIMIVYTRKSRLPYTGGPYHESIWNDHVHKHVGDCILKTVALFVKNNI